MDALIDVRKPRAMPAKLTGLRTIAHDYDLILCDVWGVLHDGINGHDAAAEALREFRALSAPGHTRLVILVSNSPRHSSETRAMLASLGVPPAAYDAILTSGDLTREFIAGHPAASVYHLGPDRTLGLFAGLGVNLVGADSADMVVCTALIDDENETAADYQVLLRDLRKRDVPMVCANPDFVVRRAARLIPCAGTLAAAYVAMGGGVTHLGKPHRAIYEAALAMAASLGISVSPARILAIGDALDTDIRGARDFGVTALLVASGIHESEIRSSRDSCSDEDASSWLSRQSVRPDMVIQDLVW